MGSWCVKTRNATVPVIIKRIPTIILSKDSLNVSKWTILSWITDYYKFEKVIGNGHFGTVREAFKIKSNQSKKYAIKSISKESVKGKEKLLQQESENLYILDHPSIIKLYEIYEDAKYVHLVTELWTGGDLLTKIIETGVFSE